MAETVRLLYFAWVRERIGVAHEVVPLDQPLLLHELVARLCKRSAGHEAALAEQGRLRAAINEAFVGWDAKVAPGDEVAIFPPVTGG